jgi:PAS domain-containing protein
VFPRTVHEQSWNGHTKDRKAEVRAARVDPQALQAILLDGKLTELHPGDDKALLARVKAFFPDSNPFGSLLVAPIEIDAEPVGALFLVDSDHKRKYSEGERDFFWTVALMTAAFMQAREKLEREVQLRTLITNAPVIMFALDRDGVVTLFEGRGAAMLKRSPEERIGKPLLDFVGNSQHAQEAIGQALEGRIVAGEMLLEGTLFETQYSPLRGVDGKVVGVMGVTTAILDAPRRRGTEPSAVAATAGQVPASSSPQPLPKPRAVDARERQRPSQADPPPPTASKGTDRPRPAFPSARSDLKPTIPLADED